ncbi:Regulator of chromosome condensation [Bulinus truncatus]|nr:Regulator of chromosome condensation [Bulinus truncatus]
MTMKMAYWWAVTAALKSGHAAQHQNLKQEPEASNDPTFPGFKIRKSNHDSHGSIQGVVLTCGTGDVGQLVVCLKISQKLFSSLTLSVEGSEAKPGKVNIPASNSVMVTAGDSHTAALTDDGRVYAWGNFRDANGKMGLTSNGIEKSPRCAEQGQLGRIAECFATRGGRKGLGKVYTLGRSDYGRLGLGENCEDKNKPTVVPSLEKLKVVSVAAGGCVSLAVADNGDLYSWGMGSNYQLGHGNDDDQLLPTKVVGKQLESRAAIMSSSGGQHTVVLAKDVGAH